MKRLAPGRSCSTALAGAAVLAGLAFPIGARSQDEAASRGAQIAAYGNGKDAPACASCHGYNGMGDPSGAFPRLAGQPGDYLAETLTAFATGLRKNAVMSPVATALSDQDRRDVAAYYASVSAPMPPAAQTDDPHLLDLGRSIANVGVNDQQIPACAVCHGPSGQSVNPTIPSLAGQYGTYIAFELRMIRDGYHQSEQMGGLAHRLTDPQVKAVAAYFQSVGAAPGVTAPRATKP